MTKPRRFGMVDLLLWLLILAGAAGARAWYLTTYADGGRSAGPVQVQDPSPQLALPANTLPNAEQPPTDHDLLLHNMKEHRWFGSLAPFADTEEPTAHVAPGYTWTRAWLDQVPMDLGPSDWVWRWLHVGLGALTASLYFLFARRAFRSRLVATLAGALCAVYPFWIINTAELNDGVLITFLLALALFLGTRAGQSGGALTSVLFGLTLAGAALTRAALLPLAFVGLLWFLLRCRQVPSGWLCAILGLLGFAGGLAPWTLRNFQVHQDMVPIVTTTHYHLWAGNNPNASGGPQTESALLSALVQARQIDKPELTAEQVRQELANLPQAARYRELGKDVVAEIARHPARTIERRIWAGLYFFFGQDWFTQQKLWSGSLPTDKGPTGLAGAFPIIMYATLLGMLLLAVLGWRWSYGWKHEAQPSSLAVIWVTLPYLLSHAEQLSGPRLPLDGVFLSYAALAGCCLLPGVGRFLFGGSEALALAQAEEELAEEQATK
ncbi:MAG: glycosyltransferase family 39 protein [Gemmataceae bacterium]